MHVRADQSRIRDDRLGDTPPDAVVAAQRVAVAHDDDARPGDHRASSSRTEWSGARSWTRSGISPSAWVEHERHGS